ncbi:MAG: hydrogenase maturation protease, partial [Planctomycetota bacterium]
MKNRRVLIAGLGNSLLMDDGVGVHAVRALLRDPPDSVEIAEIGTAVLDALHLLENADIVIALDAIQAGRPPGTVLEISEGSLQKPGGLGRSVHEVGLREAIAMLPQDKQPQLIILGVEPAMI